MNDATPGPLAGFGGKFITRAEQLLRFLPLVCFGRKLDEPRLTTGAGIDVAGQGWSNFDFGGEESPQKVVVTG